MPALRRHRVSWQHVFLIGSGKDQHACFCEPLRGVWTACLLSDTHFICSPAVGKHSFEALACPYCKQRVVLALTFGDDTKTFLVAKWVAVRADGTVACDDERTV